MKIQFITILLTIALFFSYSTDVRAKVKHVDVGEELSKANWLDADTHLGDAVTATILVAAYDSSNTQKADYSCDGNADQVQVQAALDALPAYGGKVVMLEGNYVFSVRVNFYSDDIELYMMKGVKITMPPSTDADFFKAIDKNNIYIHGGELDGANQVKVDASCSGVIFSGVDGGRIEDMIINNTWNTAINVTNCNRTKILRNRIYNLRNPDLQTCGMLIRSVEEQPPEEGDIIAMYNHIETGYGEGVDINRIVTNVFFTHNTIIGFPEQGIDAGAAKNTIITNNIVRNCGTNPNMAAIIGPESGSVSNNVIEGGNDGIRGNGPGFGVSIVGNDIYGQTHSCIRLQNGSHYNVIGNRCHSADFYGIRLSGASHYNCINGNQVYNNSQGNPGVRAGIQLEDTSSHNSITGNTITDNREDVEEKTQGRAIKEEDTPDYNMYKNNMMLGNITESVTDLIGVHNTYDISAISVEMDLSDPDEDFFVFHAVSTCVLVGFQTIWTEAAGDSNTCTIRVGEIEDDGTTVEDEFASYTTNGGETLGQVTYKKYGDLNNTHEAIEEGHSITVGHTQKTGGGKVRIVLQIAEMAD